MKSLVRQAQRGDDQAFVELIEENKQTMYKVAVGILRNDSDAADAIQESILTCYERMTELKKPQYFKTWLLRILINNCNQMLRERKKVIGIEQYYGTRWQRKEWRRKDSGATGSRDYQRRLSGIAGSDGTAIPGCFDSVLCRRDEHTGDQSDITDE